MIPSKRCYFLLLVGGINSFLLAALVDREVSFNFLYLYNLVILGLTLADVSQIKTNIRYFDNQQLVFYHFERRSPKTNFWGFDERQLGKMRSPNDLNSVIFVYYILTYGKWDKNNS